MRRRGVFRLTRALGRVRDAPACSRPSVLLTNGHVFCDCVREDYYTEASSVLQGKAGTLTQMGSQPAETARRPRADAARNRERVLEAARTVFSAGGADASLEAVAKQAGVGIGTLYRHFPTREALFEAVYRREVEQLGELAEQLKSEAEPVDALRRWLRSNVEFVATKKGMVAALALAAYSPSELHAYRFDRLTERRRRVAGARGCGWRHTLRYSPRGSDPRARRHVLHARPARLAGDRHAAVGCVRRRPSFAGRRGETGGVTATCRPDEKCEGEASQTAIRDAQKILIAAQDVSPRAEFDSAIG